MSKARPDLVAISLDTCERTWRRTMADVADEMDAEHAASLRRRFLIRFEEAPHGPGVLGPMTGLLLDGGSWLRVRPPGC
jgi:hypothetical protein